MTKTWFAASATRSRASSKAQDERRDLYPAPRWTLEYQFKNSFTVSRTQASAGTDVVVRSLDRLDLDDRKDCLAKFRSNQIVGLMVFTAIVLGRVAA